MSRPLLVQILEEDPPGQLLTPAAEAIRAGGIVGHPTETVYGLAVDPWNGPAVGRLRALKGRSSRSGLILLVSSVDQARDLLAAGSHPLFDRLAAAFWPGPLSIVGPAGPRAPGEVLGGAGGVALRLSADPVARRLVECTRHPVTSTSANLTGHPAARSAEQVVRQFGEKLAVVIDGGPRRSAAASTVVDLAGPEPRILREGPISRERIERALGLS